MSIRAEWRLQELLGIDDGNPFDRLILSTGLRVDLRGSEEEIERGLGRTLELESRLHNQGITCKLKDDGQDCLTCPVYVGDRPEETGAPLCRLGRDQRVIEDIAEKGNRERRAPIIELAAIVDRCTELGHLEPEYAELLTAVGL